MIPDDISLKAGDMIKYNPANGLYLNIPGTGLSIKPNSITQITEAPKVPQDNSYNIKIDLSPSLVFSWTYTNKVLRTLFDKITIPNFHVLKLGENKGKKGLFHPSEQSDTTLAELIFAIPVKEERPFDIYECWTAYYEGIGEVTANKPYFLMKIDEINFVLEHPDIKIPFKVSEEYYTETERFYKYIGKLTHSDFQYQFILLDLIDGKAVDYLIDNNNKNEFIIGVKDTEYTQ